MGAARTVGGRRPTAKRALILLWRQLTDWQAWRHAGVREYRFATAALNMLSWPLPALRYALSAMCFSMVVLGLVMQFHPYGPHEPWARALHATVLASSFVVGLVWLFGHWPTRRWAIAFIVWADLAIAIAATLTTRPEAQICATIHLSMLGVFVGFLLGWRIFLLHSLFCVGLILALAAHALIVGTASAAALYIFVAPALMTDVALPAVIQVVVEGGRVAAYRVTGASYRDPLTGLLNRRGIDQYAATRAAVGKRDRNWLVVGVVDLDRFKALNDAHGHGFADDVLRLVAVHLTHVLDRGQVARVGGDEFVLVWTARDTSELDVLAQGPQLTTVHHREPVVTASVGLARGPLSTANFRDLVEAADRAMYAAKRSGGGTCVIAICE